jgi:FKBP-type peptidyl-prolyl cis-trans isomerase
LKITTATLLAAAMLAACASAQERKPAPDPKASAEAQPACKATPKELVKQDLAAGEGREVRTGTGVLVHYTGWLYDGCKPDFKGKMFDSSRGRPVPFGFIVGAGKVIKGWDEGLVGMKEKGARRLLLIPPDKGYGEKGAGDRIPPNSALVFEVETVQIVHYPAEGGPPK